MKAEVDSEVPTSQRSWFSSTDDPCSGCFRFKYRSPGRLPRVCFAVFFSPGKCRTVHQIRSLSLPSSSFPVY